MGDRETWSSKVRSISIKALLRETFSARTWSKVLWAG